MGIRVGKQPEDKWHGKAPSVLRIVLDTIGVVFNSGPRARKSLSYRNEGGLKEGRYPSGN